MTMRRTRTWAAVLAILALAAASCGGGSSDDATDGAPDDATDDSAKADPDAVMRFMWGTPGGSNYDPHEAFNPFVNIFLYPAYDRLLEMTPDSELRPMLAESWEFQEDDTVLRLNLRQDVTFHDGEPFNAEAVKANIERGQTLKSSSVKPDLASVDEVVVVDEYTVDLMLGGPGAALPALLSDRAGMMVSPAAFDNEDLDLRPVGTGAYQVDDHQPGSLITYEPFPDYWDPEAQTLGGIEISMQLDPEARLRALQADEIDATTLNPDQIEAAEAAGLEVQTSPIASAFLLYLNKTKPGLDDPLVREAISLAIDRDGINDALHLGLCPPSAQIFPPGYWAGDPDVEADPYDVEEAQSLMEEAGYGDGLALSAVVVNVPFYLSQLEVVQEQLAEIDIELTVTALEPAELLGRFLSGKADMTYSQWPGAVDPAKTVATLLSEKGLLNPGGYTNPQIDELAAEGASIIEQEDREPIYQELSRVAAEDRFHIVVCNPEAVYVVDPAVQGLVPTLGLSYEFRGVTISK